MIKKYSEEDRKRGALMCKKGYVVGSDLGLVKCPKCKFRNSKEKGCHLAIASAKAMQSMNKMWSNLNL